MYTFNNLEAIKNKFDNETIKHPKKINLKKRISKVQGLDFKQTSLPEKKEKKIKTVIKEENESESEEKESESESEESESEESESEESESEESESEESESEESESEESESEESESEEDQVNRNTIYEYDGKKYTIDNEKFLQKRFDDIEPDTTYKMNMCIYKCVRDGYSPYLLYLMKYDEVTKSYILPNESEIQLGSIQDDDSVDKVEEKIMNIFKETLFNIYPPNELKSSEESTDLYDEELFKGFFLHNKTNEITMVYDATRVNVPLESSIYCWVSPYEIFVSKKMKSISISETVETLFDEIAEASSNRHDFYHLKQLPENTIVKTPYILFMCKQNESSSGSGFLLVDLFNTKKTSYISVEASIDEIELETIVYPNVQHPFIGNYTLFSSFPFTSSNLVKRFVVFVDTDDLHPLYVEPTENTLTTLYDVNKEQYTSITFIENETQIWCIKSCEFFTELPENGNYLLENENIAPIITEEGDIKEKPDELPNKEPDEEKTDELLNKEPSEEKIPNVQK